MLWGRSRSWSRIQFWGPVGPARHRRTRRLHDVATPKLLPELIPVWPLTVKVAAVVTCKAHREGRGGSHGHSEPSLVRGFGVSLGT